MGNASPNAFGAQLAFPGGQTTAMCGGGFTTLALGDLLTEVQRKMSVIHIFLNNSMLDFVNIEQEEAFLASLMQWAMDGRRSACSCPVVDGRADCKGDNETEPNYLFLGPKGGHPRRSNYADRYLTPAAEGFYPARNGTRRPVYVTAGPWPGIPIRKGNGKTRAADVADGTWPDLTGKFRPHDDRHTHATWLDAADLHKVIQMDRRGHAMPGMDAAYNHITLAMRQRLCDVLEQLWRDAVAQRYELAPHSAVPLLEQILDEHGKAASSR